MPAGLHEHVDGLIVVEKKKTLSSIRVHNAENRFHDKKTDLVHCLFVHTHTGGGGRFKDTHTHTHTTGLECHC